MIRSLGENGNVLLPVDTSGRVLELLVTMDQYWIENKISFTIAFLSYQSYNTIEFAKSQLEWMSDAVVSAFDLRRENVFAFKLVATADISPHRVSVTLISSFLVVIVNIWCPFLSEHLT